MLLGWTVAMAVLGIVLGSIAPNIGDLLDSPSARDLIERLGGVGAIEDTMIAAELSIAAVIVTCFAIAVVGHGSADEHDGRTEQVLATATSRTQAFLATLVVALLGVTWLLLVTGVAVAIGYGSASGSLVFDQMVPAALAQAPAVWLVAALAVAAYTLRSSWAVLGWVFLVLFLTVGQLGELLSAAAVGDRPVAVRPRAADAGRVLHCRPVARADRARWRRCSSGSWLRFRTRDIG